MTIHGVASYLACFDAPPTPAQIFDDRSLPPPAPEDDPAELRRQIDLLRADLEAQFAEKLARERADAEGRLARARELWTLEQAEPLMRRTIQAIDGAFESLRSDLAIILAPFVSQEIARKAIDDLVGATRSAIASEDTPALTLAGPKDLIEKVARALAADNWAISIIESKDVDVRMTIAKTTIETGVRDWIARLAEDGSEPS